MQLLWLHWFALILQLAKLLAFFSALVLPAAWVSVRRLADISVPARLGIGSAAGFALFVVAAWYLGTFSFDLLLVFWLAQFPIAAWLGLTSRPTGKTAPAPSSERFAFGWWTLAPVAIAVLLQIFALHFSILPQGVDAAFHCVVAQRQADAGQATTHLRPLEDLDLNYPIGSHLWLAIASHWTGLPIHDVFRHSFAIALIGCSLVLAAWSERQFGTAAHGVAASFAFVLCFPQASLFPYTWGGLPSLMAMWLGLAGLFAVCRTDRNGIPAGAVMLAAMAMVHHHTMVAMFGGIGAVAVVGWLIAPARRTVWARLVIASLAACVVASIYVIPLVLRATQIHRTSMLQYSEPRMFPWEFFWVWSSWTENAVSLVFTSIAAAVTTLAVVLGLRGAWRQPRTGTIALLVGLSAVWLLAFAGLDYGSRVAGWFAGKESSQPFTPSRFIFDVQFIGAILAAGGLVSLWNWLRRPAFRFAVLSFVGFGAVCQVEPRWIGRPDDALVPLGRLADQQLPPDALVTGAGSVWATYIFHRETTSLFIPISEPADTPRMRLKLALRLKPNALPWSEWSRRLNKPVYLVGYAQDPNAEVRPLITSGEYGIYDAE